MLQCFILTWNHSVSAGPTASGISQASQSQNGTDSKIKLKQRLKRVLRRCLKVAVEH